MPTQKEVEQARKNAGLTCAQAAELVGVKLVTWARWEGKTSRDTVIPAGLWELFQIKTSALKKARENPEGKNGQG